MFGSKWAETKIPSCVFPKEETFLKGEIRDGGSLLQVSDRQIWSLVSNPPPPFLLLCRLLQCVDPPHLSWLWEMAGTEVSLWSRPGLSLFSDCSHPTITCNFPAFSFVLSDLWFAASLPRCPEDFFCFLNKGVRGFRQTQMWMHSLPPLTFTALCGPNSLCLLSKDWLGKRPSCAAAPKSQHKVNSSSALINHHFLCKCSSHYERFSEMATNSRQPSQIKQHFSQEISENSQMTCKGLKINMKMRTLCASPLPPPSFGLGLTHENAWRGRAFCCRLTIMSRVRCRNANLQPGDRTMKWAIYGWLLTTLAFRPPYWKQVFYESSCCLFPTIFIVRNLRMRKLKESSNST